MTAEDRALALLVEISRVGKITMVGGPVEAKVSDIIAAALRAAENDALERAAVLVRDKEVRNPVVTINGQHFIPLIDGPKIIAAICANIRSLKHKEPVS